MRHLLILTTLLLMVASGCKKRDRSNFPDIRVDHYVYLNNPQNSPLQTPGGWVTTDGGYRGLIVVRRFVNGNQDDFAAFDRACPEHFSEDCSTLEISDDDLFAVCPCHQEKYLLFDGSPSEGARYGLQQYGTNYSGGVVYIYN